MKQATEITINHGSARKLGNSHKKFGVNKQLVVFLILWLLGCFGCASIVQQLHMLAMCFFLVDCMHISVRQAGWFRLLAGKPIFTLTVHYLCVPK